MTGDVTFYAIWKIQKHTLTYDANGGKIHDQDTYDEIHDYGETVPIVEAPVREHFKFLGWQEVDGQTYQPGDDYTVEGDTTFIAQWEEIPIKITYDPNGGIFRDSTDPTVIEQSAFDPVIIAEAATREHFKFVEWNTKPDGTGDPYDPEAVTEFSEDVTFYAIWEQIKCTVTYVPNGGKFRGSEDPTFIEYNEGETIAIAEAPTRQGYTFVGWFWQGEEYQPGDEVVVSDDMIFSAHWKKNESPVDPVDPVKPDKPDTPDKEKKAEEEEEESTETGDSFLLGIGMLLLLTSAGTGLSLWRRRRAQ